MSKQLDVGSPSMAQWYCSRHGQDLFGPCSAERLKELAATGELLPGDLISKDGQAERRQAFQIKGLFGPPPAEPARDETDQMSKAQFYEVAPQPIAAAFARMNDHDADAIVHVVCPHCGGELPPPTGTPRLTHESPYQPPAESHQSLHSGLRTAALRCLVGGSLLLVGATAGYLGSGKLDLTSTSPSPSAGHGISLPEAPVLPQVMPEEDDAAPTEEVKTVSDARAELEARITRFLGGEESLKRELTGIEGPAISIESISVGRLEPELDEHNQPATNRFTAELHNVGHYARTGNVRTDKLRVHLKFVDGKWECTGS